MKIQYKKRYININLAFGILWFAYFIAKLILEDELSKIDYVWLLISAAYWGIYFYQLKYKYISIENGIISKKGPLGKKMPLADINMIKRSRNYYTLKTGKNILSINIQIIDSDSLSLLKNELKKLNVKWH